MPPRQHRKNATKRGSGKTIETADDTPQSPPLRLKVRPELTFGYTREELQLPQEQGIGVDEMW